MNVVNLKILKKIFFCFALITLLVGCEDQLTGGFNDKSKNKMTPEVAFDSENGLKLYVGNFYRNLPYGDDIIRSDGMSDFLARKSRPSFLVSGSYTSKDAGGWSWGWLRTINYFLENAPKQAKESGVSEDVINKYVGAAKFFRAYFYFEKVKRFGNVPWYSEPLDPADSSGLFKAQDSRSMVMDSIMADLDYAIQHSEESLDVGSTTITKWVALAFKSRVGLFEGTFRKYHPNIGLEETADALLEEAASAAEELMNSGKYKIHVNNSEPEKSYRELFTQRDGNVSSDEVILSYNGDSNLNIYHDANYYFTSASYGNRLSLVKQFVNTYLNKDGSRFTDLSDYQSVPFWDEVKGRDLRLQQTIRMDGYSRENGDPAAPDFKYTMTGYHPIKFTLDESGEIDNNKLNDNSLPIIRYAEVLLNYAEARTELGLFSQSDWDKTIKVLRQRAGIVNSEMPNSPDSYLQEEYFPDISDPILLEVRRERGVELVMEGFRFDDLRRWKKGDLLEMPYMGVYVPAVDEAFDLNGDGKNDVAFVKSTPSNPESGVTYVIIGSDTQLTNGTSGNVLWKDYQPKEWEDFKYVYPIPFNEIVLNPNLEQNPGWD